MSTPSSFPIQQLDPTAAENVELVAARMQPALVEALGKERGTAFPALLHFLRGAAFRRRLLFTWDSTSSRSTRILKADPDWNATLIIKILGGIPFPKPFPAEVPPAMGFPSKDSVPQLLRGSCAAEGAGCQDQAVAAVLAVHRVEAEPK